MPKARGAQPTRTSSRRAVTSPFFNQEPVVANLQPDLTAQTNQAESSREDEGQVKVEDTQGATSHRREEVVQHALGATHEPELIDNLESEGSGPSERHEVRWNQAAPADSVQPTRCAGISESQRELEPAKRGGKPARFGSRRIRPMSEARRLMGIEGKQKRQNRPGGEALYD